MVLIPSKLFGMKRNTFFKNKMINPPKNPAISAPKNPELTNTSCGLLKEVKVVPAFAMAPPTNPTTNPWSITNTHCDISC